jgi:hypothetical protein
MTRKVRGMIRIVLIVVATYGVCCLALFLARSRLVFPIRGGAQGDPARFGLTGGESVAIPVSGGVTLSGWFLPALPAPAGRAAVVVWFHGNGETVAGLAPVLREFRPPGVALLAVEYRGYGGSGGTPTVANTDDDALAVGRWLDARSDVDPSRLVVYGRSIGSGPAIRLASSRHVAGLIIESGFTSLKALARKLYVVFPSALAGDGFDNIGRIERVRSPMLFIHGDRDGLIPIDMGRALAERAGSRGEFWAIRGADHNDSYDAGGGEYVSRFRSFVARVTSR